MISKRFQLSADSNIARQQPSNNYMTDKTTRRKTQAAYLERKHKAGYIFPKLCIHASILGEVKALIQRHHKKLLLAQLTKELASTTGPATTDTKPS